MKMEHFVEQMRKCSERNSEWDGTPQSRAGACFAVERQAEHKLYSNMERSTHLLVGGTVEQSERSGVQP